MLRILLSVCSPLFRGQLRDGIGHGSVLGIGNMGNRGSRFLSYNFLQFAIDGKNNSKTKVEKAFFFIFMSSYAEMS
jgi:hypothetical protein